MRPLHTNQLLVRQSCRWLFGIDRTNERAEKIGPILGSAERVFVTSLGDEVANRALSQEKYQMTTNEDAQKARQRDLKEYPSDSVPHRGSTKKPSGRVGSNGSRRHR